MAPFSGRASLSASSLKARVAEGAEWLRGLVEGADEAAGGDLLGQLSELVGPGGSGRAAR